MKHPWKKKRNQYSQLRADQMPGPSWVGQLMCTFLNMRASTKQATPEELVVGPAGYMKRFLEEVCVLGSWMKLPSRRRNPPLGDRCSAEDACRNTKCRKKEY